MLITEKAMENGPSHQTPERRMNLIKLGVCDDNKSIKHVKRRGLQRTKRLELMSSEKTIDSCLAYEVLKHPERWIGDARASYVDAFLLGAEVRSIQAVPSIERSRIYGVLGDIKFREKIIKEAGKTLSISAIHYYELTYLSFSEGCTELRKRAIKWHREMGVADVPDNDLSEEVSIHSQLDYSHIAKRPGMYFISDSAWSLYCFFIGLTKGGDWLGLPDESYSREIFDKLCSRSKASYGTDFGIFRVYDIPRLLALVGISSDA